MTLTAIDFMGEHASPWVAIVAALVAALGLTGLVTGRELLAQDRAGAPERALLRLASDSATVGHYKFTLSERRQLLFDIPADDPRAQLLSSASQPKQTAIALAATVVSTPVPEDAERRYTAYWLGFNRGGSEGGGLTPVQWDSIFQKVGRRAVLRFTPLSQPLGVEVGSDAVRPVGQALGEMLSGLALQLPPDSVTAGDRWYGRVAVPVRTPDGERRAAVIQVTYRLRAIRPEADGPVAHIEFDGEVVGGGEGGGEDGFSGRYFGEGFFSLERKSYDRVMALANLVLEWNDPSGLPPARLTVDWQAAMERS